MTAGQPQRPAGRGGRVWWTAAAAVVVLAVAVAGIREILNDSRPDGPARPGGGRPSASATARPSSPDTSTSAKSASPGPASSGSPAPAGTAIPRSLAGSWSGQVSQGGPAGGPADVFGVRVVLRAGANSGTIAYTGASFTCTGSLIVTSAGASQLGLRQQIITGRRTCADGAVTIQLQSPGALLFTFRGAAGPQARGTLRD